VTPSGTDPSLKRVPDPFQTLDFRPQGLAAGLAGLWMGPTWRSKATEALRGLKWPEFGFPDR
jgi:hypothetical protein